MEILEKAWSINKSNLDEPYFVDEDDCIYYGTRGHAKSRAIVDYDSCTLLSNGENIDYLTVKVRRRKESDVIRYTNGEVVKRSQIVNIERRVAIKNLPEDDTYYVQDRRSYVGNSILWWAKGGNGYTTDITKAHKYSKSDLQKSWRDTDIIWSAEHVDKNIKQHVDMQSLNYNFKT